ncbi:MAG TPA: ABC transporter permease [Methylomirabilota bacterium]|nr:ABC transporter permease [Methylomirabilota bacterium]
MDAHVSMSAPAAEEAAGALGGRLGRLPGAVWALAVMAVVWGSTAPGFLTLDNLTNIGLQAAVLTIVALGMTLIMLTEGIDLSLGPVLGLAGVVLGLLVVAGRPLPLAMLAAVGIGVTFGVLNGLLVAVVEMPPFVVTMGTFGMAQSLAMVLTEGNSVTGLRASVRWFNEGIVLGVPVPLWATALVFAVTWGILYRTRFGRYVYAIGGNRRALRLAGVRVRVWHTAVYVYGGILAAVGAFIMTARMNAAHPTIAVGLEFDAIAAVVLGGTSFDKGRGGIYGTVAGALAVGVLRNGLNLVGLSTEWQVATVGLVIIAAIVLDALRGVT